MALAAGNLEENGYSYFRSIVDGGGPSVVTCLTVRGCPYRLIEQQGAPDNLMKDHSDACKVAAVERRIQAIRIEMDNERAREYFINKDEVTYVEMEFLRQDHIDTMVMKSDVAPSGELEVTIPQYERSRIREKIQDRLNRNVGFKCAVWVTGSHDKGEVAKVLP